MTKNRDSLDARFQKPKEWKTGSFINKRGMALRTGSLATHFNPVANIVIVPGLSEYSEKFYELARDFNARACNVFIYDPPGQGHSDTSLENPHKQHSTGTKHDIDDLVKFRKTQVPNNAPTIVFAHSTGGLVAMRTIQEHPDLFDAATITAPLFGLHNPIARNRERFFANLPLPKAMKESYIPGGGDWTPRDHKDSALKADDFTSDPERQKIQDYWATRTPAFQKGGVTWGWVKERCKSIIEVRKKKNLAKVDIPVFLATAGNDKLVNNQGADKVAGRLSHVLHMHFSDAKHEMYLETDDIRTPLIDQTMAMANDLRKKGWSPS